MPGIATIFRTTNPVDFTQVDGVYIDERKPPGKIRGIGNDLVCCIGEFEWGPVDAISSVSNTREFQRVFGGIGPDAAGASYQGYIALLNKQFGRLRIIRVSNGTQAKATRNLNDTSTPTPIAVITCDALYPGVFGNKLSVTVSAASNGNAAHFNLTVLLNGASAEVHRNLDLAGVAVGAALPIESDYIKPLKAAAGNGRPANVTNQALSTGSDGTFADADYTGGPSNAKGMRLLFGTDATNIRWVFVAERTNDTLNAALRDLCDQTKTKIALIAGPKTQTKALALTDVVDYRSDRMVYVYPWVETYVPDLDAIAEVNPVSFAAAALSSLAPGIDPAGVNAEPFLSGIRGIRDKTLDRADYVSFNEQGIMALQFTAERQRYSFRSGRTTSLDPALQMILRRTMADYLQESLAAALAFYQNRPLTRSTKIEIQAAIADFLDQQIVLGLLPGARDLEFGDGTKLRPYEVDIDSLNTPQGESQGLFIVLLRVRIFASIRFLVLRTEIGEAVEITALAE